MFGALLAAGDTFACVCAAEFCDGVSEADGERD